MRCGGNSTCSSPLLNVTTVTTDPTDTASVPQNVHDGVQLSEQNVTTASVSNANATVEPFPVIPHLELSLIMAVAVVTTVSNLVVLLASKFASGGKSPTLVFIRSLCVSDSLIGIYGLLKTAMYMFIDDLLVNFFLAESLFFTASLASGLSLLSLNIDSFMKLAEPMNFVNAVDKKNVITIMVMLWNLSFIAGFLPQMGWRTSTERFHVIKFFVFHPWHYLLFFSVLLLVIFMLNLAITIYMRRKIVHIQSRNHFLSPESATFKKYHTLVITAVIDMVLWMLCYLPYFIYLSLFCDVCHFNGLQIAERNIVYFIPIFLTKSFISAVVHGYRTAQINAVMKKFSRTFSKIVQNSLRGNERGPSVISRHQNGSGQNNGVDSAATNLSVPTDDNNVQVLSSQLTLYSTVRSSMDIEVMPDEVTKL